MLACLSLFACGDDAPSHASDAGARDAAQLDASTPSLDATADATRDARSSDAGHDAAYVDGEDAAPPPWQPGDFPKYPDLMFPLENPVTPEKAMLGKILFWDEQLSSDDSTACGSCHRPSAGGADPRAKTARHPGADTTLGTSDDPHGSVGIARCTIDAGNDVVRKSDPIFGSAPQVTRRRAPTYLDAMFAGTLFLDGRATSAFVDPLDPTKTLIASGAALESQALGPLRNDVEMACEARDFAAIIAKLTAATPLSLAHDIPADMQAAIAASPSYPELFALAFGTSDITAVRIAYALATHERTLRSDQTPFDVWNAGHRPALTEQQYAGMRLFMGKALCVSCHRAPMFHDFGFHSLGFSATSWDKGRAEITGQSSDDGRFRTPTLRNVGLREPLGLMHDGVGKPASSLEELVAAYAEGKRLAPNTSVWIAPFTLTPDESAALVSFVRDALTDPRVRDELPPFDRPKLSTE